MAKTALVTGASAGIGFYICESLAKRGYNLVITARREDKLKERKTVLEAQYGIKVLPIAADLSLDGEAGRIYTETLRRKIRIDLLVNNAGFGNFGKYSETDWQKECEMMHVNIISLAHLTKLYLRDMTARGSGKILNMSSIAGFMPGPMMSVYYASKAFVLSFSEALSRECADSGVSITAVCPGPTDTEFSDTANLKRSKLYKMFKSVGASTAAGVAEYSVRAALRDDSVAVYGLLNKLLVTGIRFIPRELVKEIVYYTQERV